MRCPKCGAKAKAEVRMFEGDQIGEITYKGSVCTECKFQFLGDWAVIFLAKTILRLQTPWVVKAKLLFTLPKILERVGQKIANDSSSAQKGVKQSLLK